MTDIASLIEKLQNSSDLKDRRDAEIYLDGKDGRWPKRWEGLVDETSLIDVRVDILSQKASGQSFSHFQTNKIAAENLEEAVLRDIEIWRAGRQGVLPKAWASKLVDIPTSFPVLLSQDNSGYVAFCPLIPGVFFSGESREKVLTDITEEIRQRIQKGDKNFGAKMEWVEVKI